MPHFNTLEALLLESDFAYLPFYNATDVNLHTYCPINNVFGLLPNAGDGEFRQHACPACLAIHIQQTDQKPLIRHQTVQPRAEDDNLVVLAKFVFIADDAGEEIR